MKALCLWWRRHNFLAPHIIVWRCLWVAPLALAVSATFLLVAIVYGRRDAVRFWKGF